MSPQLASIVYTLGILGLFFLDRDRTRKVSPALWIPVIWLWIAGSRMVSDWLNRDPITSADQVLDGSPLDRNILLGLTVLGVIVLIRRGDRSAATLKANMPLVLFFSYCALSTLWSDYPFVAFKRWIKLCGDLVMALIVLTDPNPSAALKRVFARFGFVLLPLSILFIRYYSEIGRGFDRLTGSAILVGVTNNKNHLGMISFISGLGAVWRLAHELRRENRSGTYAPVIAQGVLLAMATWLLWTSRSMTALLSFVLASGLIVATSSRTRPKAGFVHLLAGGVLTAAVSILFLDVGGLVLEAVGRDPTLTGRTVIWGDVMNLATNPWVGAGFESFWLGDRLQKMWAMYWWQPTQAHNGYLDVFLNVGIAGLALFAMIVIVGYRNIVRLIVRDPDAGRFRLASFVVAVSYNFTESAVRAFHPLWLLLLLAIIAVPEEPAIAHAGTTVKPPPSGVDAVPAGRIPWKKKEPARFRPREAADQRQHPPQTGGRWRNGRRIVS